MIKRELYLNKIVRLIDKDPIKIITGVRRSGKTYLLKSICEELKNRGLFDEIQNVKNWEKSINAYRVDLDCDIYITGSNSELLSGEMATLISGRYYQINIYPFSFEEFVQYKKEIEKIDVSDLDDLFKEYVEYGGMPPIQQVAAEDKSPSHQRWKVWEDKILLRMFYEDMGLHAIKKKLERSYISVRTRIRAITMPEEVMKGREFEDFVLELFDLNETNAYSLLEWRGDKSTGEISPKSNSYPDFVLEYKEGKKKIKFSVECKWRVSIPKRMTQPLVSPEQITRYQEYSNEKGQKVFVILGVGGEPSMPEELYLIPLELIQLVQSKPSLFKQFRRNVVDKWFSINEFETL